MNKVTYQLGIEGQKAVVAGVESVADALDRNAQAQKKNAGAATEAARAAAEAGTAARGQASELEFLRAKYDPAYASSQRLTAEQQQLKRALDTGAISQQRYSELLGQMTRASASAGVSMGQITQATRQLPLQMQDVFVSLQGGQNPLTVFMQQGAQIAGSYGSAGLALRSVGAYLAAMLSPVSVAAVAVGGLALAAYQGGREMDGYRSALTLTGNALGVTAGQLDGMATAMRVSGTATQGAASEALVEMATSGRVAKEQLQSAAEAALAWSRATGASAADVAKNFADLAKDPLAGTLRLNEGMNYLTASTYQQIKALMGQGRATEAAAVAQKAYADTLLERSPELVAQLGFIERGWLAVSDSISKAWSVLKGWGREMGPEAQLTRVQATIAAVQQKRAIAGDGGAFAPQLDKELAKLREQESVLQSHVREMSKGVALKAEQAAQTKGQVAWDEIVKSNLSDEAKLSAEIARIRSAGLAAKRSEKEIQDQIDAARAKAQKAQSGAGTDSGLSELQANLAVAKQHLADLERLGVAAEKQVPAHEKVVKLQFELAGALTDASRANKEKQLVLAKELEQVQQLSVEEEKRLKWMRQSAEESGRAVENSFKRADAVEADLQKQRDHNATIGLSAAQLVDHKNALDLDRAAMLERRAEALASVPGSEAMIDAIKREAQALRDLAGARTQGGEKQAAADAAKKAQDDWQRAAENMERSMTDALMRAFEGGKDAGKAMADTLANYFKTAWSSAMLKPLLGMVTGALNPAFAGAAGSTAAGGSGAGVFSRMAGAGEDAIKKLDQTFTGLQEQFTKLTGSAQAGQYMATGAAVLGGTALGTGISAGKSLIGGNSNYASGIGSAIGAYFGGAAGAVLGGAAGGLANAAFGMGEKRFSPTNTSTRIVGVLSDGTQKSNLQNTTTQSARWEQAGGWFRSDKSGVNVSSTTQNVSSGVGAFDAQILAARTLLKDFSGLLGASGQIGNVSRKLDMDTTGMSQADLDKWIGEEYGFMMADMLSRSQTWARGYIKAGEAVADGLARVAQTVGATADAMALVGHDQRLLDRAIYTGGREQASSTVGQVQMQVADSLGGQQAMAATYAGFFSSMFTEAEQTERKTGMLKKAFADLGLEMPKTREAFRQLVDQQDIMYSTERYAGLLKLSEAFAEVVPWTESAATAMSAASVGAEALTEALKPLADERFGLESDLLRAQGKLAEVAARERDRFLTENSASMTAGQAAQLASAYDVNIALRDQVAAAQAAADAERNLASERANLDVQLLQVQGDTAALRARELAALNPANRALQEHIWALQDEKSAATEAAQAVQAVTAERANLENQLLQAQGDTAALRARELAALNPANRALQEQIWTLEDQQAAAAKAAQLAEQAAQAWQNAGQAMRAEIDRIRGVQANVAGTSYAQRAGAFATATAAARAGDVQAAQSLANLSQSLLEQAAQEASSREDFLRTAGLTAASLERTLSVVGMAPLPSGEPAPLLGPRPSGELGSDTPARSQQSMADILKELTALRQELAALRRDNSAENASLAKHTSKTTQLLNAVTQNGQAVSVITNDGDKLATKA